MSIVSDGGSPLQPQLDISKTTGIVCKCGNHTFVHGVFLREISAIASPTGKGGVIPIPTFTCNSCGLVPDAIVPPFLKTESRAKPNLLVDGVDPRAATTPASALADTPTFEKSNLTLLKN